MRALNNRILPCLVLLAHVPDRLLDLVHVTLRPLNRRVAVPLSLPSEDVVVELGVPALFLLDIFAQFALVPLHICFEDQFEAARLTRAVLFRALLAEVPKYGTRGVRGAIWVAEGKIGFL